MVRRIAGETLVIPIRGQAADLDAIYVLNDTAAFLWAQLDHNDSPAALAAALCQAFDVSLAQSIRDVTDFLSDLGKAGLIRAKDAAEQAA
ncbi:MAG: PqqD family protein [Acidobacteriota bacterium]|nr:PqqD family protein [Acidobacteriota bacterium]